MQPQLNIKNYQSYGIDWPICAISEPRASTLYQDYLAFHQRALEIRGRDTFIKPHLISTMLDELVHNPIIVQAVCAAIGPDVVLWTSDMAIKPAGKGNYVPWHQDTPYWNLSSTNVVSVWLALTPANQSNGAMQVIKGTHTRGKLGRINIEGDPHEAYKTGKRTNSEGNIFAFDHEMTEPVDESLAVDVELSPGEFSLHNIELLHGGGPNPSDSDRVGFVMRFMSADTYCLSGKDSVTCICGEKNQTHFVYEPRPVSDCSPEAMAALVDALTYPSGFGDRAVR